MFHRPSAAAIAVLVLGGLPVLAQDMSGADMSGADMTGDVVAGIDSEGRAVPVQFQQIEPDPSRDLVLRYEVRLGVGARPAYFGSDEYVMSPDFAISFDYVRVRGLGEFGPESVASPRAFGLRGSLRFIGERNSEDYSELDGLDNVPPSLELGLGAVYRKRNFEAWADARYGALGHNSFAGELGADGIVFPTSNWEFRAGPRLVFGGPGFADAYFSVSPSEAEASGLPEYQADGGLLGAGLEAVAKYRFNELWGIEAGLRGDRLLNDAADSPITKAGSADQFRFRVGITRELILQF